MQPHISMSPSKGYFECNLEAFPTGMEIDIEIEFQALLSFEAKHSQP